MVIESDTQRGDVICLGSLEEFIMMPPIFFFFFSVSSLTVCVTLSHKHTHKHTQAPDHSSCLDTRLGKFCDGCFHIHLCFSGAEFTELQLLKDRSPGDGWPKLGKPGMGPISPFPPRLKDTIELCRDDFHIP